VVSLDRGEAVDFLNDVMNAIVECKGAKPDEAKDQVTEVTKRYCGQAIDALGILVLGYKIGEGEAAFKELMNWDRIERVNPRDRWRVTDMDLAISTHNFLNGMMNADLASFFA
jgi:hypothetical protein